ncbi:endonuclease/exonuclease/phosphatase family protein [Salinimicrobium catena]|uniref:endonuclease/exonuclease/phosphatase family protein n=1 Tax=Salinimicrobium catena TaxID=390640 RepID=UPI002FE4EC2B
MSLKPFLQAVGILAVILTLFPFVAADYWWIRMFDYPHVQLTTFTLVALLVYFFRFDLRSWRDYAFVVILAGCFLFQLTKIYPYTPLAGYEVENNEMVDPENTLSLMVSNVLQKNTDHQRVLDEVLTKDPDMVILTETNHRWRDALAPSLQEFGYIYKTEMPLDNTYGMLLYSKLETINPQVRFLLEDSIPSMHMGLRIPSGKLIEMHIIHPTPPMPPHDASSTDRDAQMMMVAKMARNSPNPVIVAGDFNDVAWSESTSLFQNVSELLDPRVGRGFYNTFNANSWLMRWPLDHLFVSEEFRVMDLRLGNDVESDHFPLYVKLSLEPTGAPEQEREPATKEELKEAEKQIEKEEKKDQKEKTEGKS